MHIVHFKIPSSLIIWLQHYGQAGRSDQPAIVILLVEPSIFQVIKPKKPKAMTTKKGKETNTQRWTDSSAIEEPQLCVAGVSQSVPAATIANIEYKKRVDPAMHKWVQALYC